MPAGYARALGGAFDLALAKAVPVIPARPGLQLEPKVDGFRAAIVVEDGGVRVWSRNGTDLTPSSVGVGGNRSDVWPSESAVNRARQVSLTYCWPLLGSP